MARYRGPRRKVCRRLGTVLPGISSVPVLKRPYPPGQHGASRKGKPSDFKIRLIGDYSDIDEACCVVSTLVAGPTAPAVFAVGGALNTDFFSYDIFLNKVPENKVKNYGGSANIEWSTGPLTVTSISAYRELKNFFRSDID